MGTFPEIAQIVLQRAREAGAASRTALHGGGGRRCLTRRTDAPGNRGAHAPGGMAEARAALIEWIDEAGDAGRTFLQVRLLRVGEGLYEIRHARDVHRSIRRWRR